MKVLVTGGTGLIGHALQHEITESDFMFLSRVDLDLTNQKKVNAFFEMHQFTHVIHLAAKVGGLFANLNNNIDFMETNLSINLNVLSACNNNGSVKKVLSCMSTCIFPKNCPLPLDPINLHIGLPHHSNIGYSYAKRLIDIQSKIYWKPDKPFITITPTNIYGKYDNFNLETGHVIPALIHKCYISKRDNTPFNVLGSGNTLRQFIYAKDIAILILKLLSDYNNTETVILTPSEEYSIKEIVYKIAEIMEFTGPIAFETLEEEGQYQKTASNRKVKELYPDFAFTSIDQGLKETIDWFNNTEYKTLRM